MEREIDSEALLFPNCPALRVHRSRLQGDKPGLCGSARSGYEELAAKEIDRITTNAIEIGCQCDSQEVLELSEAEPPAPRDPDAFAHWLGTCTAAQMTKVTEQVNN